MFEWSAQIDRFSLGRRCDLVGLVTDSMVLKKSKEKKKYRLKKKPQIRVNKVATDIYYSAF